MLFVFRFGTYPKCPSGCTAIRSGPTCEPGVGWYPMSCNRPVAASTLKTVMVESAWFTTYAKRDGIVTPIVTVAVVLPAELLAVTVWIVVADAGVSHDDPHGHG